MLNVDGINIENLPYGGLELKFELLSFEDRPLLQHFIDASKNDIIAYWVDFDETTNRWLYSRVTKKELFSYLIGALSLRELFQKLSSDFLFLIDFDINDEIKRTKLINSNSLPEKYLPKDGTYFKKGLNVFYSEYLSKFNYLHRLREKSYIFKVEPANNSHANTVGAKEAALVLNGATDSMEGYIKVRAYNKLKDQYADVGKINRRVNKMRSHFSPRISEAMMNSFEVWLAMDTITYNEAEDKTDSELRNEIIEGYKNDVLNVDYSNDEDAKAISEKFTLEERNMIFKPLINLFDNTKIQISITDFDHSIDVTNKRVKLKPSFKEIVFPKPTLEEVQEELNKKNKIVAYVFNIKEGEDITTIKKKNLVENLIFKEDWAESPHELNSPIEIDGKSVPLSRPLRLTIKINGNGDLQIFNSEMELYAEGNDIHEVSNEIKRQFIALVEYLVQNPGSTESKIEEAKKYLA